MAPETVRRPIQLEIMTSSIQKNTFGDSLVVQWLRLHPPSAREQGSIPGQGPRSDRPQLTIPHAATQPQHSQINKYFKKLFKKKTLKKKKKVIEYFCNRTHTCPQVDFARLPLNAHSAPWFKEAIGMLKDPYLNLFLLLTAR